MKSKVIRTSTVAISLDFLLKGQLTFLNAHFEVVAVSGFDEHLANVAKREGVRTESLEMQRKISPLKDLVSLWQLFWLFRKEKPQIVHSITPKAGLLTMAAAFFARVPIRIHSFTGLIFPTKTGSAKKLLIVMDKLLCYFATDIYPEGEGVKKDLFKFNITNKPLNIIANGNINGLDIDYFDAANFSPAQNQRLKNRLGIKASDFVFIFVGRLVGDKGINELVNAFKQLQTANCKLLLVGPYEQELDALKAETLLEIENNNQIISVGFQQDVRPYFAIADALVFPSYREGFPNVVLQAGAMGLPSIVTNINGCNEIIIEGENGKIVPPKSTAELLKAMTKIHDDQTWRMKMQGKSRQMIAERYEQSVVWDALLTEYRLLLRKQNHESW